MAEISALVLPFFGLILLGYGAGKVRKLGEESLGWLNFFIIYIALPALFFKIIGRTPVEQLTRFDFILTSLAATYSVFAVVFVSGRVFRRNPVGESTLQGLAAAYGNIGYLGPGIAFAAFGEAAALPLALIFAFENLIHFTIAPAFMAFDGHEKRPPLVLAKDVSLKIALHPFILATLAGFVAAFTRFEAPIAPQTMIDNLAQAAAPCALFAMGVTLALRPLKRVPEEIPYIVPAKLIALPVVMYLYMSAFGNFPAVWVETALLLSALPTATNVFVIAQQYDVWRERASATVLITTIISVLTVSALLYLLKSGVLPIDLFP
ncbi:AEC family transporter [Rhizobium sp. KVB221]|uniref:AEC family transporter n=1 Tax=Rhizobium setariae TaxID=2801340 RepID=A0A937CPW0_9HYPH|nr:AEC family transporter [Rhizobium setariae]MBL0373043.1 AEC family transporter [Rhizobium setariae]